jgi:modulator of FtsH protease
MINKYKFSLQNLFNIINKKKIYLLQIFSNLIFQILITFVVYYKVNIDILNNNWYVLGTIIIQFIIIYILIQYKDYIPIFFRFLLLILFSMLFGLLLKYVHGYVSDEIIKTALLGTCAIFLSMLIFGFLLVACGVYLDYRFGLLLLGMLIFIMIFSIVVYFMGKYKNLHKGIAFTIIILFSLFIIYDTNKILYEYDNDPIASSLDYYLDFFNIFVNLIDLQ